MIATSTTTREEGQSAVLNDQERFVLTDGDGISVVEDEDGSLAVSKAGCGSVKTRAGSAATSPAPTVPPTSPP